jgi:hypothetical protein
MNSIQKLLTCLLFGLVFVTYSCKDDDDDPVACNWTTELEAELNAVINAATVYGNDPTPANCQAYKNAYQDYLNELDNYVECAALSGQQAEYQAALDDAQAQIDALQC